MTMAAIRTALSGRPKALSSGVCQSCDLPIEPERLRANPYALTCRDCAAEQEVECQRARRTGGKR